MVDVRRLCAALLFGAWLPTLCAETADDAAGRPKWEAGLVVGAGWVADYPGADQSHARGLLAPLVIYRGPILRVDRDGVRGRLLVGNDFEFDVSASAAFNARDSDARLGMPDLDYLFGVGPQLIYKGLRHAPGGPTLHLKLRAQLSTDFHDVHRRGATFDPELRWHVPGVAGTPVELTFGVQPTWASRALHRYFYQVDPAYATPTRPAYRARAGYLGTEIRFTLNRRVSPSLAWFATVRGLSLHGSANADSPLLRDKSNVNLGVGLLWTPLQSTARASD
jgi:outer membrane protein